MKEDAFGRVNAEASEQFRVLERQLDHLTHFLKLLTDTADVFVGDALGLPNVFLGNGFVFDDNLRVGGHHNDALGTVWTTAKGKASAKRVMPGMKMRSPATTGRLARPRLANPSMPGPNLTFCLLP